MGRLSVYTCQNDLELTLHSTYTGMHSHKLSMQLRRSNCAIRASYQNPHVLSTLLHFAICLLQAQISRADHMMVVYSGCTTSTVTFPYKETDLITRQTGNNTWVLNADGQDGVSCQRVSSYISTHSCTSDLPWLFFACDCNGRVGHWTEEKFILKPDKQSACLSYLHCEVLHTNHKCALKPHSGYIMGFKMRMQPMWWYAKTV